MWRESDAWKVEDEAEEGREWITTSSGAKFAVWDSVYESVFAKPPEPKPEPDEEKEREGERRREQRTWNVGETRMPAALREEVPKFQARSVGLMTPDDAR